MWRVVNVIPKFNNDFNVVEFTELQIMEDNPYCVIPATLRGDLTKENHEKIIDLVLEDFYQRTYHSRAENEKIRKIDENLIKTEKMLEKVESRVDLIQKALLEFTLGVSVDEEEDTENTEDTEDTEERKEDVK